MRFLFCFLFVVIAICTPAPAVVGGPDAFGYTWCDSLETDGPALFAVDTTGRDEEILRGEDVVATVSLETPFVFYGQPHSTLRVSRFGYIATDLTDDGTDNTSDCPLPAVPDIGPDAPRIYAFHGNYSFTESSSVRYAYLPDIGHPSIRGGGHVFSWFQVIPPGEVNPLSFQVILGDNFEILFQAGSATGTGDFTSTQGIQQFGAGTNTGLDAECGEAVPFPFAYAAKFSPPTTVVTTAADKLDEPAGAETSLREALRDAPAGSMITFAEEFTISPDTALTIDRLLSIQGPATITGAGLVTSTRCSITNLNFADCTAAALTTAAPAVIYGTEFARSAPGLIAGEAIHLSRCHFTENTAGGASLKLGTFRIDSCVFQQNTSTGNGAGLAIGSETAGNINNSSFVRNVATGDGGGLHIAPGTGLQLQNCTVSTNIAGGTGGGICSPGSILGLAHCSIVANRSSLGFAALDGPAQIDHTIFQGNSIAGKLSNFAPGTTSRGYNMIDNGDLGTPTETDVTYTAALLAPLAFASTEFDLQIPVHAPLAISPAINAGNPIIDPPSLLDQRRMPRISENQIDIGAVEAAPAIFVTNTNDTGAGSLRQTLDDAPPGARVLFDPSLSGDTITFTSQHLFSKSVAIDATTLPDGITISGGNTTRVFRTQAFAHYRFHALNIRDGSGSGNFGSALRVRAGHVLVSHCSFFNNSGNRGAGIYVQRHSLNLINSTLAGNTTTNPGSALHFEPGTVGRIEHCTIVDNVSNRSFNIALTEAELTSSHTIYSDNTLPRESGPVVSEFGATDLATFQSRFISEGYNVADVANRFIVPAFDGPGDLPGISTPHAAIADNGGWTWTCATTGNANPAADINPDPPLFPALDQRGFPRRAGAGLDAGAAEDSMVPEISALSFSPVIEGPFLLTFDPAFGITDTLTMSTDLETYITSPVQPSPGSSEVRFEIPDASRVFYRVERE